MSQAAPPAPADRLPQNSQPAKTDKSKRRTRTRWILATVGSSLVLAVAVFYGGRAYRGFRTASPDKIPSVRVQRGDLTLTITAQGELRGKDPQILTAPMMGGTELHITSLLKSGTPVNDGDVIVGFDTTEQEYKLKEAEADLAEAEQHILQAKAQQQAQDEEDRYALSKAKSDIVLAELDVRKNPLLAPIVARQNDLALKAARDHLEQLQSNLANRQATNLAAAEIQEAGRTKAESQAKTARDNIRAMTLKASRNGYVSVDQNSNGQFFFFGMTLPLFQVGDAVRPGMAVAEVPDLKNWEVSAQISELDRGHIAVGDQVDVKVIAVPDAQLRGHIEDVGGTSGPPWYRRFSCKVALDHTIPLLRPGMSTRLVITTDRLQNVLWLPAQALFESDGKTFVYLRSGNSYSRKDVKLVRRNETRVVVSGLSEGQVVALANPLEVEKKPAEGNRGALQAVTK